MDILLKVLGIILIIAGFLIVKNFPGVSHYQSEKMALTGVFIGLIILFAGLALLFL